MFAFSAEACPGGDAVRVAATRAGAGLSFAAVLQLWSEDDTFVNAWSACVAGAPWAALRMECPPVNADTLARAFECALLPAPELVMPADPVPFRNALDAAGGGLVATFANLSGDAILVVPRGIGPADDYAHLAAFLRGAPREQVRALWRAVAAAMAVRLGPEPVWLSTAGTGVAWLHVRLDRRPKYYLHAGYRRWRSPGGEVSDTRFFT